MKAEGTYHVHDAELLEIEDFGVVGGKRVRLTFGGASCGHGYRRRHAIITMDECAIAKLKETLQTQRGGVRACLGCDLGALTQANFCSWCGESLK